MKYILMEQYKINIWKSFSFARSAVTAHKTKQSDPEVSLVLQEGFRLIPVGCVYVRITLTSPDGKPVEVTRVFVQKQCFQIPFFLSLIWLKSPGRWMCQRWKKVSLKCQRPILWCKFSISASIILEKQTQGKCKSNLNCNLFNKKKS